MANQLGQRKEGEARPTVQWTVAARRTPAHGCAGRLRLQGWLHAADLFRAWPRKAIPPFVFAPTGSPCRPAEFLNLVHWALAQSTNCAIICPNILVTEIAQ